MAEREVSTQTESTVETSGHRQSGKPYLPDVNDDLLLVRRLLARDEEAWQHLILHFRALICHRISVTASEMGVASNTELEEEVFAEVLAELLARNMGALRQFSGRSRLTTYVSVIVRRTAIRYINSLQRPRPHSVSDSAKLEELVTKTYRTSRRETVCSPQAILDAMAKLSPDDAQILKSFYAENSTYESLAAELQISVNAVGPKLSRARQRLRAILQIIVDSADKSQE